MNVYHWFVPTQPPPPPPHLPSRCTSTHAHTHTHTHTCKLFSSGFLEFDQQNFLLCSVFYVFYEQYLTIVNDSWQNLLYCLGMLESH